MSFPKKNAIAERGMPSAVDDEELEGEEPVPAAPAKKKKGKMPVPGAGTPAWKKIAAAMAKK
jgi:hypothetical protein